MKVKRILAIIGVIILVMMYVLTLVFALMKSQYSFQLFIASAFCTVAVPFMIHLLLVLINIKNGGKLFDNPYKNQN